MPRKLASLGPPRSGVAGPATECVDMARVGPGSRVLDVAAGAGRRPSSRAGAPDSGHGLAPTSRRTCSRSRPRRRATRARQRRVRRMDGEELSVPRQLRRRHLARGLIYFPEPAQASPQPRRAAPGSCAAIVYGTTTRTPSLHPVGIIRRVRTSSPLPASRGLQNGGRRPRGGVREGRSRHRGHDRPAPLRRRSSTSACVSSRVVRPCTRC